MRPTLLRLLSAATVVSLFAPAPGPATESGGLRLATFTCDVTPPVGGHPLIWVTSVETVETPLLAKGVVLDDGQQRYVLCSLDWCGLCNSSHELFRDKIAAAARTDPARVAVHSVHQHTAPYTDGDAQRLLDDEEGLPLYVDFDFLDEVSDRLAASVHESLGRLEPFDHLGTGQAKVDRVASSRRIPTEGGKVRSRMSSCTDPELIALPEGMIDPIDLSVLEIGDVCLLHLPGESMIEFQLFAQRVRPEAFVAVAAYGDVGPGYICTERSFSEGGYEPTASRVAPHSEGLFKNAIRQLLQADPSLN